LLTAKKRGIVEAEVVQITSDNDQWEDSPPLRHSFNIIGPALRGYRVALFALYSRVEDLYPVKIELLAAKEDSTSIIDVEDREDLDNYLRKIFASRKTRSLLASIEAHSGGMVKPKAKSSEDEDVPF
ncbi:MAG TPA: hypothetical protein PLN52_04060, partial [Opitutaceae bacterium]|nr:hypothetical protein [Opitutaceae bacterium]